MKKKVHLYEKRGNVSEKRYFYNCDSGDIGMLNCLSEILFKIGYGFFIPY